MDTNETRGPAPQHDADTAHADGTPGNEHPDLVRLRQREAEALAQGYTEGDVNHHVQPIIGMLRLRLAHGTPVTDEDIARAVRSLTQACNAEVAWLAQQRASTETN